MKIGNEACGDPAARISEGFAGLKPAGSASQIHHLQPQHTPITPFPHGNVQPSVKPLDMFPSIVMANPTPSCRILLLLLPFIVSHASANCYLKNGTDRNGPTGVGGYKPCNTNSEVSMCCADTDHCRTDGLCTNFDGTLLWRESCTDQSWKSPSCINLCVSGIGEPYTPNCLRSICKGKVAD